MNLRILFCFFLLVSVPGICQKYAFEFWHDGKIVLDNGDTLKGQVKYNLQNDILEMQRNGRLETYTSRKVATFEIFDVTVKRYREFYSLPYALQGQYKAPIFFELLQEGKLTLLAREALEVRTYSSYYSYGNFARTVLVNKYFLLKEDGSIQPFSGKKNDLIGLMGNKSDQVEKFMKEKNLSFDRKYDVARIVEYYDSFFR